MLLKLKKERKNSWLRFCGAGKTTLIRIINQIINKDEGEILIFGEKLKPSHIEIIG